MTGFLSEKEPLQKLSEYFAPWEEVAGSLPQLIVKRGLLHQTIQQLPLLDHGRLSSEDEWWRAQLLLTCISHAYVWCDRESAVAKVLPSCLAVPWVAVSNHLDIPPVITNCSYILHNWQFIDPSKPLSMENMKIPVMITGSWTEEGFVKIPLQVELDFGKGIKKIISGLRCVLNGDKEGVLTALLSMKETLVQMTASFSQIQDVCDPNDFYHKLRPFLAGWLGNPALPDGLVYEGVSLKPLQYSGGSAAESSVFQVFDVVLGVIHSRDTGGQFLVTMRQYMPPKHRAFIETLSAGPSFRKFALESGDVRLLEAYNQCVEKLKEFRNVHLKVVARYVVIPARKGNCVKKSGISLRGTGGSGVMSFLKDIRNETGEAVCRGNNNEKNFEGNIT